ncbi:MAG TPA: hypothetical protein VH353_00280 [Caulobacteraceae bacterium]|jgi:uncharacterized protein with HEPN domain|nr:hypothetical protein [Caulobacteraceae bacterium]
MPDEERLRLKAIADRVRLLRGWTEGLTEADFLADVMLRDASALSLSRKIRRMFQC